MRLASFMFGGTYTLAIAVCFSEFDRDPVVRVVGWMMLRLHPCAPIRVEPGTAMLLIP